MVPRNIRAYPRRSLVHDPGNGPRGESPCGYHDSVYGHRGPSDTHTNTYAYAHTNAHTDAYAHAYAHAHADTDAYACSDSIAGVAAGSPAYARAGGGIGCNRNTRIRRPERR